MKATFKTKEINKPQLWIHWCGLAAERLVGRPTEKLFATIRPYLLVLVILTAFALMLGGALLRNRPVRAYVKAYRAIKIGTQLSESLQPDRARAYFEKAIRVMSPIVAQRLSYDHRDVIHCILFSAMSYERLGEAERAEVLYRLILAEYPYSRYVGEAYVKIARLRKQGRDQAVEDGLTRLSQGDIARGLSLIRKGLNQTQESLRYFNAAIEKDPYSVWADYALNDIKKERDYLRKKQPLIASSCDQQDVQNFIEAVLGNTNKSIDVFCGAVDGG